ncbi:MAG: hypothetical protein JXB49_36795 [Bacteroidales bacterium]|nr:hypothetical protein [Bacteroidales bacterium]
MKVIIRIIIGTVFLASAVGKFLSIDKFELYMYSLNLVSLNASMILSRLIISVEGILGFFLIFNIYAKFTWRATLAILSAFSMFLIVLTIKGSKDNCHCFGEIVDLNPLHSLIKNLIMIALLLIIKPRTIRPLHIRAILPSLLILAGVATPLILSPPDFMMYKAPETAGQKFDMNNLTEQTIEKFTSHTQPEFFNGKVAICFYSTKCNFCKLAAKKITILAEKIGFKEKVVYVFMGNPDEIEPFYTGSGSGKFPYFIIHPKDFLRITHNQMPKIFFLEDGIVKHIYEYRNLSEKEIRDFFSTTDQ